MAIPVRATSPSTPIRAATPAAAPFLHPLSARVVVSAPGTTTSLVFPTMGTMVSLTVPLGLDEAHATAVQRVFADLHDRFTMYEPDSEASRVSSGELALNQASREYRGAYALALEWRETTRGAFTPFGPDGQTDLSGVVKAIAIQRAGEVLAALPHWCLNAGGDVLVQGYRSHATRTPWVAGIVDPMDRSALVSQATLGQGGRAIATSGTSERGAHVWSDAATPRADETRFVQVSVQADDMVTADVCATAILAGGVETLDRLCDRYPLQVLAISADQAIWSTRAFMA